MKYVASRLSEGNKIFPAEIITEESGITIKIPGLFSGDTTTIAYDSISAVEIDTPLIGYSTIRFYHSGNKVEAHGFSKSDVNEIKAFIEEGRSRSRSKF
ncbi:PH domain-containing protein [Mucilaginibacter terrigena]|uniref:PH domain-containing protein n=1 Tax=Mucilaginibacter terrigena TaxID=2492395 RepID=A0A4Q5LPG7_9SPHI|nr:PH domain-containing protein [Mucilaginibacter terrigena]RYU91294.1 PH domain-containing protein [Mucilaginibacter terrigena]